MEKPIKRKYSMNWEEAKVLIPWKQLKQLKIAYIDTGYDNTKRTAYLPRIRCLNSTGQSTSSDQTGHGNMFVNALTRYLYRGNEDGPKILSIQAADQAKLSIKSIIRSMEIALEEKPDILSLNFSNLYFHPKIARLAYELSCIKTIILAPAGNHILEEYTYPASLHTVLACGSLDHEGQLSSVSNRNECIDLYCQEEPIENVVNETQLRKIRNTADFLIQMQKYKGGNSGSDIMRLATFSGTSFSLPVAVAAIACLKAEKRNYSIHDIRQILHSFLPSENVEDKHGKVYPIYKLDFQKMLENPQKTAQIFPDDFRYWYILIDKKHLISVDLRDSIGNALNDMDQNILYTIFAFNPNQTMPEGSGCINGSAVRRFRMRNRLKVLNINLTEKCNFQCSHCGTWHYHDKRLNQSFSKEMKIKDYLNLINQAAEIGCGEIIYSGGEPLLSEDIWDILDYTDNRGIRFTLLTNGSMIGHKEVQKLSCYSHLKSVRLSLDYSTDSRFEKSRGIAGGVRMVASRVQQLTKSGIKTGIGMTLMKDNLKEMERVAKIAEDSGADYIRYIPVLNIGEYQNEQLAANFFSDCLYRVMEMRARRDSLEYGTIPLSTDLVKEYQYFLLPCSGGEETASVNAYGQISFCPLSAPKPENASVHEVKLSVLLQRAAEVKQKIRNDIQQKQGENCRECDDWQQCGGGCLAQAEANLKNRKRHPLYCMKSMWTGMLKRGMYYPDFRLTVNNMLFLKMYADQKALEIYCYRAQPY